MKKREARVVKHSSNVTRPKVEAIREKNRTANEAILLAAYPSDSNVRRFELVDAIKPLSYI